jgi:hypothetical protein
MRTLRPVSSLRNQRGQIIIFVMLSLVFLLVVAGFFASDAARLVSDKGEMQAALDSAALAGAGKLGFNDTVFPAARDFAVFFATQNKNRSGTMTLQRNNANDPAVFTAASPPYGDVLLGIWDPTKPDGLGAGLRFEPSLDGSKVNSVMCRYKRQIPASFFSLWGLVNMDVASSAVATANPPNAVPPDACLFPIGVGSCPFQGNTSLGCGATITFITSSGNDQGAGCLAPPCTNSAAWVGLDPNLAPNPSSLPDQINAAKGGACAGSPLKTGNDIATNNGMAQPVMNAVENAFKEVYAASGNHVVTDAQGNEKYNGKGWKVFIPVIQTDCPAGAISGDHKIVGWTTFVMTQVINKGQCAVENHASENPWDAIGKEGNCLGTNVPQNSGALRAIFGYYSCEIIPANPNPLPGPISALATKLRLVR